MTDYQQHADDLKRALHDRMEAAEELRARWPGRTAYAQGLEALAGDAARRERRLDTLGGYGGKAYRYRAAYHQARDHERVTGAYATWPGMPPNVDKKQQQELTDAQRKLDEQSQELRRVLEQQAQHLGTDHPGGDDLDLDDLVQDSADLADPAYPPSGADLIEHLQDAGAVLANEKPTDVQAKALADNWEAAMKLLVDPDGDRETELRTAVDELTVHRLAAPLFARLAAV
jgi:hypothetical protein